MEDDLLVTAREASRIVGTAISRIQGWLDGGRLESRGRQKRRGVSAHLLRLGDVKTLLAEYGGRQEKPEPPPEAEQPESEPTLPPEGPGRGVMECWACSKREGTNTARARGWKSRPFYHVGVMRETYCPECFAEWGWPNLPLPKYQKDYVGVTDDGPRVYRCSVA